MSIAYKEARETNYLTGIEEINKLLSKIKKSTKEK